MSSKSIFKNSGTYSILSSLLNLVISIQLFSTHCTNVLYPFILINFIYFISSNSFSNACIRFEIYIPFNELVDISAEIERLEKEKLTYQNEINRVEKMLSNEGFVAKAPAAKIEEEKNEIEAILILKKKIPTNETK